jgi:hypothetical protein
MSFLISLSTGRFLRQSRAAGSGGAVAAWFHHSRARRPRSPLVRLRAKLPNVAAGNANAPAARCGRAISLSLAGRHS